MPVTPISIPNNCMSKGRPIGTCKTCGSAIVEHANDGIFGRGECEGCERMRYETQPQLLALAEEAIEYVELVLDSSGEDSGEDKMLRRWKQLLKQAHGNAA